MKKLMCMLAILLASSLSFASEGTDTNKKEVAKAPVENSAKSSSHVVLTKDNSITINDVFYSDVAANVILEAKKLDARLPSGDPIYLVINSPGGSIDAGLELIENLASLNRPVHTLNIFSASMGFQTAQGLGDRLVLKNGTLMSHKARGGFYGEFPGQLDSRYEYYKRRVARMDELAAKRTNGKHTLKSYQDLIENEFWCDGEDCVKEGLADKVVTASCDKSLEGVKSVLLWEFMFMGMSVQLTGDYDLCPANTNALKYHIYVDGQELHKDPTLVKKEEKKDQSWYERYYNSQNDSTPKITSEQLFEINRRVDEFVRTKTERKVVKGY